MIIFGLTGGIGNALFALPTIKRCSRAADVAIVVECDYDATALFKRCSYARKVCGYREKIPKATRYFAPYGVPAVMRGLPIELVGWPKGTTQYPHSEWLQIKRAAGCGDARENVTDWCSGLDAEKSVDFALIPGGKPGIEWARKKWGGFLELAKTLEARGHSIQAFGQFGEIQEAGLNPWWQGTRKLEMLPDALAKCRYAIANDCGPGHLASSIGVPTLMLFTATSPRKGEPVGPYRSIATGCDRAPNGCQSTPTWAQCNNWECGNISVSQVIDEVGVLMKK